MDTQGTALAQYQRLEATGQWTTPTADRDVIVSFGRASLVLSDQQGAPLTHWSLGALVTLGPGRYAPDASGEETLEVSDPTMVAAIDQVATALDVAPPEPARPWRWLWALAALVGTALAGLMLVPLALGPRLPDARVAAIGDEMLAALGTGCGARQLALLAERLPGTAGRTLHLRALDRPVAALPGGHLVLDRGLIATVAGPDALAGYVARAAAEAELDPPRDRLTDALGGWELLRLALFPDADLRPIPAPAPPRVDATQVDSATLGALALAGLPSAPFAQSRAADGEAPGRVAQLRGGDTVGQAPYRPALSDQEWVALQADCAE